MHSKYYLELTAILSDFDPEQGKSTEKKHRDQCLEFIKSTCANWHGKSSYLLLRSKIASYALHPATAEADIPAHVTVLILLPVADIFYSYEDMCRSAVQRWQEMPYSTSETYYEISHN